MSLIYHKYPYTNFHELNLDWLVNEISIIKHESASKFFNVVSPQMFKKDSSSDWTEAFQQAIDAAGEYGAVYIPKGDYKISNTLEIKHTNLTLFSISRTEYRPRIYTTEDITMVHVAAPGFTAENIELWRLNVIDEVHTIGLNIDRTSSDLKESDSNLDAMIKNCGFLYLNTAIIGKGRNVDVNECYFNECQTCIKGLPYTYIDDDVVMYAQFRGWCIRNNRFHVTTSRLPEAQTPKTLAESITWCIDFPFQNKDNSVSCCIISGNFYDYGSASFYKGSLKGMHITNNTIENVCGAFIYCSESMDVNSECIVSDNKYTRGWTTNFPDFPDSDVDILSYIVYADNVKDVLFNNNSFHKAEDTIFYLYNCTNIKIQNGVCNSFGNHAIFAQNPSKIYIHGMTFDSKSSSNLSCVKITGGTAYVLDNINVSASANTKLYEINATTFKRVENYTNWIVPELLNGWILTSNYSKGFRKLTTGYTEIKITVSGGADNTEVFTLPEGYRPNTNLFIPGTAVWNGETECYVQINTAGRVLINAIGTKLPSNCIINCIFES